MHKLPKGFTQRFRIVADRVGPRREAARIAGVSLDAIIRYLRGENQPTLTAMSHLCNAAGISLNWLATGEGDQEANAEKNDVYVSRGLPVSGFAESKDAGWYTPQPSRMQTTLELPDPRAFAAVVHGQTLVPEGLHPGFLCVCSPMLRPVKDDIVHIRRQDGLCTLKLFIGEERDWFVLRGFTDPDAKGVQRPYEDRVKRSVVTEIAPVVFVRRKV